MHLAQKCPIRNCMKGIRKACHNRNGDITSTYSLEDFISYCKERRCDGMAFAVCTEAKQFSSGNLPFAVETLFHTFENGDIYRRFGHPRESNKFLRLLLLASLKMFYTASLWGCVCDVLRYRLHVSCRVRMLEHSTRAQVVLLPSHSLRANCYLPAKRGLTIPQSKVGFLPRVERVEHHFQLEKYNHL